MGVAIVIGLVVALVSTPIVPSNLMHSSFAIPLWLRAGAVLVAFIETVFVLAYWNGVNWARWFVMLDSVLCLAVLLGLKRTWHTSPFDAGLLVSKALLAGFLLVYLNTRTVREWFSAQATPSRTPAQQI